MVVAALAALLLVNLGTVVRFWDYKQRAIAGTRRIPEADLLAWAMLGGTPGAFAARHLFRHKTRKQPFSTHLMVIAVVQLGTAIGLAL